MSEIEEKTHALLSPSGAHRWAACPGSVVLEAGKPNTSSHYARWGTVCHEVAALCLEPFAKLTQPTDGGWYPENAEAYVGRIFTVEGHELEFDMEMADCVNDYVAEVSNYWEPGDIMLVEQQVPLDHITGETGATGTSDCTILKQRTREIVVIDLKAGKGVAVDAEENLQGIMYASGAVREHDLLYGPFDTVRIVIIQPRLQAVSEWAATDFEGWEAHLREAGITVRAAQAYPSLTEAWTSAFLNPGEKQCRFCKAKAECPALRGEVSKALSQTAGPASIDEFPDLTLPKQASAAAGAFDIASDEKLAEAMRAADLVEIWLKGVRAEVERRLFDGKPVPGFKLVQGKRGHRKWTDENAVALELELAGVEPYEAPALISPAAAEKKLSKAQMKALVEWVAQPDGKPSVAKESDKRAPWSPCDPADFPTLGDEDLLA